jgi:hypothetical protein
MLKVGGISYNSVWLIAKVAGIDLASHHTKTCYRTISAAKRARIITALRTNPNAQQVMRKVGGISYSTVWLIAKQAGIDLASRHAKKHARSIGAVKRAKIIAELRANPNALSVARKIGGVSYGSVWLIAKQAGIDLVAGRARKCRPKITPQMRAEVIAALRANPNACHVARLVGGLSHVSVWMIAKIEGIALTRARTVRTQPTASADNSTAATGATDRRQKGKKASAPDLISVTATT